ncbi:MAG: hypothetical protein Q8O95_01665 [bacterium]|nr:hypothetical protein [bacterium]
MDTSSYDSPGKWFTDAREKGYRIPPAMMQGICQTMERLAIDFPKAFEVLERHGKIMLTEKTYIFNLDYEGLLDLTERQRELILKYRDRVPTKKWAAWATKVTGNPEVEWWLQGMFYLTEVEDIEHEDAKVIMRENWDN